jgi:hypothetical protein
MRETSPGVVVAGLAALTLCACGGGATTVISCDSRQTSAKVCEEDTNVDSTMPVPASFIDAAKQSCAPGGFRPGTFASAPCPTASVIGGCRQQTNDPKVVGTVWDYAPTDVSQAQQACATVLGTWVPPP